MARPFLKGSQPDKLNNYFKQGGSLTHDEAVEMGIKRLAQRMQDLKKKYIEYKNACPIMVYNEANENRNGYHARYFYKGAGCPFESQPTAREY